MKLETRMVNVLPKGSSGNFAIDHYTPTAHEVAMEKIRWMKPTLAGYTQERGTFAVLRRLDKWGNNVVMSDTPMERESNQRIIARANGKVLILGLGLGMIVVPLLAKHEVSEIVVWEKEQDVMNLVYPHLKKIDKRNKLKVILADAFTTEMPKTEKFDSIYIDIWDEICGDNWEQIKTLKRKFRRNQNRKNPNQFLSAWMEYEVKYAHQRG